MIAIKTECDFEELKAELWCEAVKTVERIEGYNKIDEFMSYMESIFYEPVDICVINDYLWFDRDYLYEALEIEEEN